MSNFFNAAASEKEGVTCEEFPDFDEQCVNGLIKLTEPTGPWMRENQSQTWSKGVLDKCLRRSPFKPDDGPSQWIG